MLILNDWDCGGLDKTGSSRLVYLNAWSLGNGATRQVLGTGVALIVEVGHEGVVFEFSEAQARPSVSLSLPACCGFGCRTLGFLHV